ncbi:MAG: hypothetical protein WC492_02145 [Candidatus Micrarchaeia archaeon]
MASKVLKNVEQSNGNGTESIKKLQTLTEKIQTSNFEKLFTNFKGHLGEVDSNSKSASSGNVFGKQKSVMIKLHEAFVTLLVCDNITYDDIRIAKKLLNEFSFTAEDVKEFIPQLGIYKGWYNYKQKGNAFVSELIFQLKEDLNVIEIKTEDIRAVGLSNILAVIPCKEER